MNTPLFGANVDPGVGSLETGLAVAQLADAAGLDLVMIQDHPYNKDHLDTWTLLATIAARTSRVHIGTNVANVPLRTPALLAKMAASLDVISGFNEQIDAGARAAGRSPDAVRRLYNLMGTITDREVREGFEGKHYAGTRQQWIDHLTLLYREYRQDTFVFWPTEGDPVGHMDIFAAEIVPAVRRAVS